MEVSNMNMMEQRRFKNQIELPWFGIDGQLKLKNSRVIIIGAGGKGIAVMKQLAAAGVGVIGICDNAIVDEMELSRQSLYGLMDLGKQRAIVAKQYLEKMNHSSTFKVHNLMFTNENSERICAEYDLIVDATSNWYAKLQIVEAAEKFKLPLISGYVETDKAEVTSLPVGAENLLSTYFNQRIKTGKETSTSQYHVPVVIYTITGSVMANES
ncbi:MAG: ThiF family adenylyltransferase, partial [Bacteroidales bacterium]|nr:ThiF family adenylyltransferase [Bacteroidales bacterium]